jgi:riboflavin biosynthesis pyrimidine reductase
MQTVALTKLAINIVSGLGVSKILGDIIKNNTVVVTTSQKVMVNAGGIVLGSMLAEAAVDHVNATVDRIVDWHKTQDEEKKETKKVEKPSA